MKKTSFAPYVSAALFLLLVDQWVKRWTVLTFAAPVVGGSLTGDSAKALLPGLVELTRVHNYGAAWSSFSGARWMLVLVNCAIIGVILWFLLRKIVRHPLGIWACTAIIAGGLGNIFDRVRLGYVVDMFNFCFIRFPVFNVADICVVCGAILAAVYYLWFYEKYDAKDKTNGEASGQS